MEIGGEMTPIITVREMSKHYNGERVLEQLSFEIIQGEILVVLGASGVGKTTLLKVLSQQETCYQGHVTYESIVFDGIDVPLPIVFQDFDQLLPWYSVKKNILLPYKRNEFTKNDLEILAFIGLEDHLHKRPSQLSGGMKQRVAIARALLADSKIIFMDEPFGSLDTDRREKLQTLILDINKKYGKTIVFITHDREEANKIASRIATLKNEGTFEICINHQ